MKPPALAPRYLRELVRLDRLRLGPEVRQLGLDLLGTEDANLRTLLRAALGEDQLAAVLQPQPERRCLWPLRTGLEEADAARAHQVDVKDELAVVGGEEEVLAAAARAREAPGLE